MSTEMLKAKLGRTYMMLRIGIIQIPELDLHHAQSKY